MIAIPSRCLRTHTQQKEAPEKHSNLPSVPAYGVSLGPAVEVAFWLVLLLSLGLDLRSAPRLCAPCLHGLLVLEHFYIPRQPRHVVYIAHKR